MIQARDDLELAFRQIVGCRIFVEQLLVTLACLFQGPYTIRTTIVIPETLEIIARPLLIPLGLKTLTIWAVYGLAIGSVPLMFVLIPEGGSELTTRNSSSVGILIARITGCL